MVVARQLHLVRHGEVHNPERVLYGRLPGYGLSELGRTMAAAAADDLAARGSYYVALYVSPLQRARESAEPVAVALGLAAQVESRIVEPSNHFEGKRMRGKGSALTDPRNWPFLLNPLRPSWGESYRSIADRMIAAMNAAWDAEDDGDIVMVSHQLPIWMVHRALAGQRLWHDPRTRRCGLSSVTSFSRFGGTFVETGYAEPAATLASSATDVGAV
ncbi:histidine phosphatase family protein [Luethyella okanaganae]|uniref:Histidine phosphatase family protein n=1 Tax=Luethyella okanaganae TaxID=69372 RepID=A0ABW1VIK7_9MICO